MKVNLCNYVLDKALTQNGWLLLVGLVKTPVKSHKESE